MIVPPAAATPRISDAEDLPPLQLFQQYVQARGVSPEVSLWLGFYGWPYQLNAEAVAALLAHASWQTTVR